jgi:hypothetical protein
MKSYRIALLNASKISAFAFIGIVGGAGMMLPVSDEVIKALYLFGFICAATCGFITFIIERAKP